MSNPSDKSPIDAYLALAQGLRASTSGLGLLDRQLNLLVETPLLRPQLLLARLKKAPAKAFTAQSIAEGSDFLAALPAV